LAETPNVITLHGHAATVQKPGHEASMRIRVTAIFGRHFASPSLPIRYLVIQLGNRTPKEKIGKREKRACLSERPISNV
jgi:hypothetical protein